MSRSRRPPPRPVKRHHSHWELSPYFPLLVFVAYALALTGIFRDFIFSDGLLFGSDTFEASVYMKTFFVNALKEGSFPQWAPYLFGGMPFVDAFHSDILYPPSWPFYLLFPVHRALGWATISHLFLGGVTMYAAARAWNVSRRWAAIAGLNYLLAPYFISMVLSGHTGRISVVVWFPLGFLLLKRIWDDANPKHMALFALVVGLIILTPHVQMAYYALWAYGGYSVYRLARAWKTDRHLAWTAGLIALGALIVGLGISAVQFYPSYHYVKHDSPRAGSGLPFETASSWSLHPEEVVNNVVPTFSGITGKSERTYWGRAAFKDRLEYCGFVALLLALVAVCCTPFREWWFFAGLALFGILFGLGGHSPVFKLFYHLMPNVRFMRAPAMIMFFYLFGVSLLAGVALDAAASGGLRLGSGRWRPRLLWLTASLVTLVAVALSIWPGRVMVLYRTWIYPELSSGQATVLAGHTPAIVRGFWIACALSWGILLLVKVAGKRTAASVFVAAALFVSFDLGRMESQFVNVIDFHEALGVDPIVPYLKAQPGPFRIFSPCDYQKREVLPAWAARPAFQINYFATQGLAELSGYHGNQLWSYSRLLGGARHPRLNNDNIWRLLDLAGVRYVVYLRMANQDGSPGDSTLQLVRHERGVKLYENTTMLPYARMVSSWELNDPADSLGDRLFDSTFDYRHTVLLDRPTGFASAEDTLPGTAQISEYGLHRVVIETESRRPSLLVLADNAYPSWHAQVDGAPVPILTADITFRAVEVPEGKHRVTFAYHSTRQVAGIWISSISLAIVAAMLFSGRRLRTVKGQGLQGKEQT